MVSSIKNNMRTYFSNGPKMFFIVMLIVMCITIGIDDMKKSIKIIVDGKEMTVTTYSRNVKNILEKSKISLGSEDKVVPSLEAKVKSGDSIIIEKAKKIKIQVDGENLEVASTEEENSLPVDTKIVDGLDGAITSVETQDDEENVNIIEKNSQQKILLGTTKNNSDSEIINKGKVLQKINVKKLEVKDKEIKTVAYYKAAQLRESSKYTNRFIGKILEGAVESYEKNGIFPSVTLAQAILESGWGKSKLAVDANNLFGVKASRGWSGGTVKAVAAEWNNRGNKYYKESNWRVYSNWGDSVKDHGSLLQAQRYRKAGVFKAKNYVQQIKAIQKAGYCTYYGYSRSVCSLINEFDLWRYDPVAKELNY